MSNAPLPTLQVVTSAITSTLQVAPGLTPTSPEAYMEQAAQLRTEGKYAEVVKAYQTIVDKYPDTPAVEQAIASIAETYEEWAVQLQAAGKYEEAIKKYQLILDEYDYTPGGDTAPLLIAETYEEWASQLRTKNKYEEAIEIYQILSSEYKPGCLGQGVMLSVAETNVEWGQYLITQKKYIEAMDKFTQAQESTEESEIVTAAQQGYQDALWALSEDTGPQGKHIIGKTWGEVCRGEPATSPAIGLVKQDEPGRMWFRGSKRPLPDDLQAGSPGHFIYAICGEEGEDVVEECRYGAGGFVTVDRQKAWWHISVRDTRTAALLQERTFYGPEPDQCPGVIYGYGGTITGDEPSPDEVVTWLSTLNMPFVTGSATAPGQGLTPPTTLPTITPTPGSTNSTNTSPQPSVTLPMPAATPSLPSTPTPSPLPPSVCPNPLAQITDPPMDATLSGDYRVRGTANIPNLHFYKVQFRPQSGGDWGQLYQSNKPVDNGVLMTWVTRSVPPGIYWLRLVVEDPTGNYPEPCEIRVTVTR
jgi:outer membrane protein assembly factor BamD (BamD/ComL family)